MKGEGNREAQIKEPRDVMQEQSDALVGRFSKKLGMSVPRDKYPRVVFDDSVGVSYFRESSGEIAIHSSDLGDTYTLGEEVSHYFRNLLGGAKGSDGAHAAEFFGYLGRMLTSEFLGETYSPKKRIAEVLDKKKVLGALRSSKKGVDELLTDLSLKELAVGDAESNEESAVYAEYVEARRDVLEHHRPYAFASRVDLGKVKDFGELYKLPDKQVRRRFFRKDPIYDDSSGGLEQKTVGALAVLGFVLGLFFISFNFTGFSIASSYGFYPNVLGSAMFILGICGFYLWTRKR